MTIPSDSEVVALAWRKASFSHAGNNCVELAAMDGMVAVRDSKDPYGPVLKYTRDELSAFLRSAKAGEFDDLC